MVSVRFREIPDVSIECSIPEAVELIRLMANIDMPKVLSTPNTWKEYIISLRPLLPNIFTSNDVNNLAKNSLPPRFVFNSSSVVRTLRELTELKVLKRHGHKKSYKYTWERDV